MGSKMGFILSLLFVAQLFVMATDFIAIQMIYTNLDAVSVSVGYIISKKGGITQEAVDLVYQEAGAQIEQIGDTPQMIGEVFQYRIFKEYKSFTLMNRPTEIAVVRSVLIGYYS